MLGNWTFTDTDDEVARELDSFLPERIFDAHAHIYRVDYLNSGLESPNVLVDGPADITVDLWRERIENQVGKGRLLGGLFFGAPVTPVMDVQRSNDFVVEQLKGSQTSKGLMIVTPESLPETVAGYFDNSAIVGFKPYHVFSPETPTNQSSISGFLPEWAWEMADDRRLVIMLHIVRDRAISDPGNQSYIRQMCTKYPSAKLVLAHAARGFYSPNTIKGIASLRGLENVWFDTSSICEAGPYNAILREFGPRKLLWGTDFPISEMRGKAITVGTGFTWLGPDTLNWEAALQGGAPTLIGLESLRAVKESAESFGLSSLDVQDIFYNNALELLNG